MKKTITISLIVLIFTVAAVTDQGKVDKANIKKGLKSHDRALYIKEGWIRDPYIYLALDGFYYLCGTVPNPGDPREFTEPYNTGFTKPNIGGSSLRLWQSEDLIEWDELNVPFVLDQGYWAEKEPVLFRTVPRETWQIWAPEVYFYNGKWMFVHTSPSPVQGGANLAVTRDESFKGPFSHPMKDKMRKRHDPSLFRDDDGTVYLVWSNTFIAPLKSDFSDFASDAVRIDPAGTRIGPAGDTLSRIGHEGATIRKIGGKYVHFGTAWSTDRMRKGTYNLYYCTADKITGPYGPRQFAGRFLGHGTPFQDREGRWWCTAFYNADVHPISHREAMKRSVGENAHTINEQGVTIVPLDVRVLDDGDIYIRAKDPAYAVPGPEEVQDFGI